MSLKIARDFSHLQPNNLLYGREEGQGGNLTTMVTMSVFCGASDTPTRVKDI